MTAVFPASAALPTARRAADLRIVAHNPDGAPGSNRRISVPGGTASAVIDLASGGPEPDSCPPLAGDRSGTDVPVLHSREGGPVEAVTGLPRGRSGSDVACSGCWNDGAVMYLGDRLIAVLVAYSATCPWLAEALAGAR
jgi:hypothetical protein